MKKSISLVALLIVLALSGCQGVNGALDRLNNGLTDTNDVLGSVTNPVAYPLDNDSTQSAFVTQISQSSIQADNNVLMQSVNAESSSQLASQVQQAIPVIDVVLSSLMSQGNPCGAEMYKAPGYGAMNGWLCGSNYGDWPRNAPKDQPLEVQDVGQWKTNSANEFEMTLNLCSTVSQTCVTFKPSFINMGTGWKLKKVGQW